MLEATALGVIMTVPPLMLMFCEIVDVLGPTIAGTCSSSMRWVAARVGFASSHETTTIGRPRAAGVLRRETALGVDLFERERGALLPLEVGGALRARGREERAEEDGVVFRVVTQDRLAVGAEKTGRICR